MYSYSNFYKHLPYRFSRCFSHPASYTLFSNVSLTQYKPTNYSTPTSIFTPSASASASTHSINSPYLSVRILCQRHALDMFSEALLCFGAYSASVDKEEEECQSSDETYIDSIFPEGEDVDVCISQAADSIGLKEIPTYEVKMGEHYDWMKKTQESFHAVEVTEGLWIVPEWQTPPNVQATNIILNPGLSFGTGEHPTTKLCLLLLQGLIKGGELFLDYGTGSGILAIAAIKFGAASSVGVDIDPQAITSAHHNAALNNIGTEVLKLHLVPDQTCPSSMNERADGVAEDQNSNQTGLVSEIDKCDVVIANILLNPLLDLADQIVSYAKPGATVAVSGILSEQIPYIIERYSQFLEGISVSEMDDWACVSGTKKTNLIDC
ncbi:hypothetical protein LWI29_035458 [Acer saccharum]|uniref:ETFB lysine methyltransferase n=1 Tax=Acer saccharum TaxID=4024 RepID=A0AA39SZB9_ACESA|nr:hypothetical protein LWI29_035458 [Acer saccharum]